MAFTRVCELIAQRIYAMRKISINKSEVSVLVQKMLLYFIWFNDLESDEHWIPQLNRTTEEVEIPQEFADFILPNSVRYQNDRLLPDLLDRKHPFLMNRSDEDKGNGQKLVLSSELTEADVYDIIVEEEASEEKAAKVGKSLTIKKTYQEYIDTVFTLYNVMKLRPSFITLSSLRKDVLLADIQDKVAIKGRLSYNGKAVLPVNLTFKLEVLLGNKLASTPTMNVVSRYIEEMFREA